METYVRSPILESLRSHRVWKKFPDTHLSIVKTIEDAISRETKYKNGLAIFAKLKDPRKENDNSKILKSSQITILNLEQSVQKEMHLGTIYQVDQLIMLAGNNKEILVLHLERNDAQAYKYSKNSLDQLFSITNEYIDETRETQYELPKNKSMPGEPSTNKTGKIMNAKNEENKRFLHEICEKVKANKEHPFKKWDWIIIFHSTHYHKLNGHLEEEFKYTPKTVVISEPSVFQNNEEMQNVIEEIVRKKEKQVLSDEIKTAKENYALFAKDIVEVIRAARENKVDTLFVKYNIKQHGYLDENGLVYIRDHEKAHEVENIIPWLVNEVIELGGNVRVIPKGVRDVDQISARLRF